jgi:hypothetical protein
MENFGRRDLIAAVETLYAERFTLLKGIHARILALITGSPVHTGVHRDILVHLYETKGDVQFFKNPIGANTNGFQV